MEHRRISKRLSYVLRHDPAAIGIELDAAGWVDITVLLAALARHGTAVSRSTLEQVVADNDKQRFAVDGDRIRASQGHSVPVDLGLEPLVPPPVLYHGTATRHLDAITVEGLRRGARHHVHLSSDVDTAWAVGRRHGRPVVFTVAAGRMHADGHVFTRSANGVWLTAAVPPRYLGRDLDAGAAQSPT